MEMEAENTVKDERRWQLEKRNNTKEKDQKDIAEDGMRMDKETKPQRREGCRKKCKQKEREWIKKCKQGLGETKSRSRQRCNANRIS